MGDSGMINKYPATCFRCGGKVPPGKGVVHYAGLLDKQLWPALRGLRNVSMVQHERCATLYAGTGVHYLYQSDDDPILIEPDDGNY